MPKFKNYNPQNNNNFHKKINLSKKNFNNKYKSNSIKI